MISGGDAAEQVIRLSLDGMEVALRITGDGVRNIAVLLAMALKEEHKTKGKARLSSMIKSGKELNVFSVQNKDLKKFVKEAKRYGVLYCALKDKDDRSDNGTVDIIARAEDAAKIQRIMERYELASVDKAKVLQEVQKDIDARKTKEKDIPLKSKEDILLDDILKTSQDKGNQNRNPHIAKTEKSPLSERNLKKADRLEGTVKNSEKPSVKEQLKKYAEERNRTKESDREKHLQSNEKNKVVKSVTNKVRSPER